MSAVRAIRCCGMTPLVCGAVLAALVWALLDRPQPVLAQQLAIPPNPKVAIDYIEPRSKRSHGTYELLRKRQVLEELSQFLSPLMLPRTLRIRVQSCGRVNAYYVNAEWAVALCYEFYEHLEAIAPATRSPEGYTRNEVIVGGFVDALFHELGHALFDMYDVSVFGREEDAADQMSAFVMLQFGREVAVTTIRGAAFTYLNAAKMKGRVEYADEHGAPQQRFFNYICLAYGGDPEAFRDYVDRGVLPKERAVRCPAEYRQVRRAFGKTILPNINVELMKQVQSRRWLRPGDGLN